MKKYSFVINNNLLQKVFETEENALKSIKQKSIIPSEIEKQLELYLKNVFKKKEQDCLAFEAEMLEKTVESKYKNSYIGLLELENNPSSGNSTWVIISDKPIEIENFDFFMNLYFKKDIGIDNILKIHSKTNPKFTKKNHERNENLEDKQLGMWYASLLGKIKLL